VPVHRYNITKETLCD